VRLPVQLDRLGQLEDVLREEHGVVERLGAGRAQADGGAVGAQGIELEEALLEEARRDQRPGHELARLGALLADGTARRFLHVHSFS